MPEELSDALKIGRLEDKFDLYEPMLRGLYGIMSVPDEIDKIQADLRELMDSRVAVREQVITLFKAQDKAYRDMVHSIGGQNKLLEKEIADCPISKVVSRLTAAEQDLITVKAYGGRLDTAEIAIDAFKIKGWDLLFRIAPWVIALIAVGYAAIGQ